MSPAASSPCPLQAAPKRLGLSPPFGSFTGYESLATLETLGRIIKGETKSPLRLEDWREFMRKQEATTDDGSACLDLLERIHLYGIAFAQLPVEKAAMSPPIFEVISQMSLRDPTILEPLQPPPKPFIPGHSVAGSLSSLAMSEKASSQYTVVPRTPRLGAMMFTLGHHDSRPVSSISTDGESLPGSLASSLSQPRTQRPPKSSDFHTLTRPPTRPPRPPSPNLPFASGPLPNPNLQPLRPALYELVTSLTSSFPPGSNSASSDFPRLPPDLISRLKTESDLTTHPEILHPLRDLLQAHLLESHLPPFIRISLQNLHRHTALGRLLVGAMTILVALIFTFILLLNPCPFTPASTRAVPRPWRFLLLPIYLGGIGYAIGAKAGMCFWLALFGVREDPTTGSSAQSAIFVLREKWSNRRSHRPNLPSPNRDIRPSRKLRKRSGSIRSDTSMLELVSSHSSHSSLSSSSCTASTSTTSSDTRHMSSWQQEDSIWIILWRLTGTAYNVARVQDPTLLKHQRGASYRIAAYLTFVLALLSVILYYLPYIPLGASAT